MTTQTLFAQILTHTWTKTKTHDVRDTHGQEHAHGPRQKHTSKMAETHGTRAHAQAWTNETEGGCLLWQRVTMSSVVCVLCVWRVRVVTESVCRACRWRIYTYNSYIGALCV